MLRNYPDWSVLVVEPQPLTRLGLTCMLRRAPGFEVIGQAGEPAVARERAAALQPAMVLGELRWPSESGLDLLHEIRRRCPQTKLAVVTSLDESVYAERALAAGACGYFTKNEEPDELVNGLREIMAGKIVVSELVKQSLVSGLSATEYTGGESAIAGLSNRELQVFELIGEGWSTIEIAKQLQLSVKTVETYRGKLKQKLNIDNSFRLSRFAMKWSLASV